MPTEKPSDGTLVAAVLAGARERFGEIVARYRGALTRVAISRIGRRDWAEEVVQETFLCAFKSLHTYDSKYSFRTWLWTILLNQCRRHGQKQRRRPQVATCVSGNGWRVSEFARLPAKIPVTNNDRLSLQ